MWYSVGKNCLGTVIIVLSGMLLISALCGLFERIGNRNFNGVELAMLDLKSLFVKIIARVDACFWLCPSFLSFRFC